MLIYAENKCSDEDIVMPTLKISNRRIKLSLILNTDRAVREIEIGEELVTFYNGDFVGRGNKDCLCGNVEDHDKDSLSGDEISETVVTTKRRKRLKLAIKFIWSKKQSDLLGDMLIFYNELPSDSSTLKHSYLDQAVSSVSLFLISNFSLFLLSKI